MKADLHKAPNWDSRLLIATDFLMQSGHFADHDDVKQAAGAYCARLMIGDKHTLDMEGRRSKVDVITIKAKDNRHHAANGNQEQAGHGVCHLISL